ncbi:MAG: discoidin domain-containing protein [Myxococcales bacterium]
MTATTSVTTFSGPSAGGRIGEWIFRRGALRRARAALIKRADTYDLAVNQARLLLEIARRVAEPVESLPAGARPAVLVSLYREAIFWALLAEQIAQGAAEAAEAAGKTGAPSGAEDLGHLWSRLPADRVRTLAGVADQSDAAVDAVREVLLERPPVQSLSTTADEAARLRTFAEALLWELDAPHRAVEQLQVQRWTRLALVLVALGALVFGVRALVRGPDLAKPKVFKTSSTYNECTPPNHCGDLFFHTQPQDSPWIDFDLGAVKPVHRVEVTNRSDCCAERAIPLIVEVSVDDKQWIQVARRDTDFAAWTATFPKQKARYVRLRVPRSTTLHFDDVVIR